ncbi:hypothetical protein JRO89_XS09G0219900 [Xanthoceras sorbifolium]|uniref:Uncharacterized protein n=1 Tax=Xanthoceras sorbifolium TaxID=99658 RepID=A0ABQ8HMD0_9ROSI|nr:hypothetical protein JRO89_XS09G0219900 [Xanthoceras sorbifolium]
MLPTSSSSFESSSTWAIPNYLPHDHHHHHEDQNDQNFMINNNINEGTAHQLHHHDKLTNNILDDPSSSILTMPNYYTPTTTTTPPLMVPTMPKLCEILEGNVTFGQEELERRKSRRVQEALVRSDFGVRIDVVLGETEMGLKLGERGEDGRVRVLLVDKCVRHQAVHQRRSGPE